MPGAAKATAASLVTSGEGSEEAVSALEALAELVATVDADDGETDALAELVASVVDDSLDSA